MIIMIRRNTSIIIMSTHSRELPSCKHELKGRRRGKKWFKPGIKIKDIFGILMNIEDQCNQSPINFCDDKENISNIEV